MVISRLPRSAPGPIRVPGPSRACLLLGALLTLVAFAARESGAQETGESGSRYTRPRAPETRTLTSGAAQDSLRADSLRVRLEKELRRQGLTPDEIQERLQALGITGMVIPVEKVAPESLAAESLAAAPALAETLAVTTPVRPVAPAVFGRDLFAHAPPTFVPPPTVPAGPNYVVGPGDELLVRVWGKTELSYDVFVSREGDIVLPEVGLLHVAGQTMAALEEAVRRELGRYYTGIRVSVSTGRLRTVTVFVVGEVERPGAYTVSSLSTVFNALYAAGGPREGGSLRSVKLARQSGIVAVIDFYRYLLEGDPSGDARLEDGDTIFIPPTGSAASVEGEVRRPAIYELLGGESLGDLLAMAGGTRATAYLGRILIERVSAGRERRLLDVPADSVGLATPVADGDRVKVFAVLEERVNRVELVGAVKRPGQYALREGMRAVDLIAEGDGVRGEANLARAEVLRTQLDGTSVIVPFNLGRALAGDAAEDPLLQPLDRLCVYGEGTATAFDSVSVAGEVRRPGTYVLTTGMTVADVIFAAGGLTENAYLDQADVARFRARRSEEGGGVVEVLPVALAGVGSGEGATHFSLQQGDRVFIRRVPLLHDPEVVELTGEVLFPGKYPVLHKGETISEVLVRAGGVTPDCQLAGVVYTRAGEGRVLLDMTRIVQRRDKKEDIAVMDGDRVHFPRIPETIHVTGAVFQPGSIKFLPGRKPGYYIGKCGGYLDDADPGGVRVVQADGSVGRLRSWWPDPEVRAGALVDVPLRAPSVTDWGNVFRDVTGTLASLVTLIFFTQRLTQ